ncbi:MAG TPA: hypothetical protein VEQ61_01240 [Thermoleophilaceae bacterium]|nr:hypothetical protein [Thermoleophilaceae bacterium]
MDEEKGKFERAAEEAVIGEGNEPPAGDTDLDDTDIGGGGAPDDDAAAPADPGLDVDDEALSGDRGGAGEFGSSGGPGVGAPD